MNQEKIGIFIASRRREKGLTQEELGSLLGVSKNAVSKWERGISLMDISLLKPLSNILGVTLNELLSGELLNENEYHKKYEENIINYGIYLKNKERNKIIFLIITSVIFLILILIFIFLIINKTFFKDTYNSEFYDNVIINIPKYSYYRTTNGIDLHCVKLKTLKQPDEVNIFINSYLNKLEKIDCNSEIYYYDSFNDFTILKYSVNNDGISFINTIYINYYNGKYCSR